MRRARRLRPAAWWAGPWLATALAGCGGGPATPAPEAAVRAYVAAVRAGDAAAVHRLLDPETRETVAVDDVAAALDDYRAELADQADALERRVDGGGAPARARWSGPPGAWVLRTERGPEGRIGWRFEGGVFDAPTLATPVEAVRALRSALARESLPGLLDVLSRGAAADARAEIGALVDETGDPDALDVTLEGDRAVVRTPTGRLIRLLREAGEWRVDAVGEAPVPAAPGPAGGDPTADR